MAFLLETSYAQCITPAEKELQLVCMQKTIIIKNLRVADFKTPNRSLKEARKEVCGWKGVECDNDYVNRIQWANTKFQVHSLDWFPPSLRKILLVHHAYTKILNTRNLARHLIVCIMRLCRIYGEVDLQTLPHNIEVLSLRRNSLSGCLYITQLPPSIRFIDLSSNQFEALYVDTTKLPRSLVNLAMHKEKNHAQIVFLKNSPKDSRIQQGYGEHPSIINSFLS